MSVADSEPLGYLLHRVAATLRPEVAAVLTPLGLGLPEFVCLRIISLNPGLTSAELARVTNVSAQATNQLCIAWKPRVPCAAPTPRPRVRHCLPNSPRRAGPCSPAPRMPSTSPISACWTA